MNDFYEIINGSKPTLVDFYATWCGPCKMQAPVIEKLKEEVGDEANILKIDTDKNHELSMKFRIMSIPTLAIFRDGQMVWRESGYKPLDYLRTKLREYTHTETAK